MTSDAKVGLLLGLVFIVIIAFLINGLPDYLKADPGDETINTSLTGFNNNSTGLTAQAEEAINTINGTNDLSAQELAVTLPSAETYRDVRYTTQLPNQTIKTVMPKKQYTPEKIKTNSYVVQPGDNLAEIAKRVYGSEQGNKRDVVAKLFEANSDSLSSPDRLIVGQELLIPPLQALNSKPEKGILENVKTIITNHKLAAIKNAVNDSGPRQYTVKPGDSLWRIAADHLGDGSRYHEIVRLNDSIVQDEEDIVVGMKLKLPRR